MAAAKRIRTPWKHRWRRFRYTVLPFLFFAGFTVVTARLWERQVRPTQAVGLVDAVLVPVSPNIDGRLAKPDPDDPLGPPQRHWIYGDTVHENQIVARLEDDLIRAQAETVNASIMQLEEQLDAVQEQARIDQADRDYDHNREQTRLTLQHQDLVVQALQLDVQINFDQIDAQRLRTRLEFWRLANKRRGVTPVAQQTIEETKLELAAIEKRISENIETQKEVERQARMAAERVDAYPDSAVSAELHELLDPVKAQIETERARLEELRVQIESFVVRSPISGTVTQVFAWPGQNIRRGEPIIEVAANEGKFILAYLPERKNIEATPGMEVTVRPRNDLRREVVSVVEHVGPQVQLLPMHLWRDPTRQEWGLPVKIRKPPGLEVRPGQLMDLTFDQQDRSG